MRPALFSTESSGDVHVKKIAVSWKAVQKIQNLFPWVYDNEILKMPANLPGGETVEIVSPEGRFLASGYANPASKICVRILAFEKQPVTPPFIENRIYEAVLKRKEFFAETDAVRLVHAEADGLPGLIVDSYAGYLSLQINTAGMEKRRESILGALRKQAFRGIYEKPDARARIKEGLPAEERVLDGEIPDRIEIREDEIRYHVRLRGGQKTGFYLDQRRNRKIVADYVRKGARVLDCFCHAGGFGMHAAVRGAGVVRFLDESRAALEQVEENASLNGVRQIETIKADAFDYLAGNVCGRPDYDLVILDPPSFAKTKRERHGALKGFRHLILNGARLLRPGGLLAVFSCSHHVEMEDLVRTVRDAAVETRRRPEVLEWLKQDLDHPVVPHFPPSLYLKGLLLRYP